MRRTKFFFRFVLIALLGAGLATMLSITSKDPASSLSGPPPFAPGLSLVSGPTSFAASGCNGAPQTGTVYPNAEVEPWVAVNPTNPNNIIGVWQQDRWSNGGANGLATGVSFDAGRTWSETAAPFTRCSGGNASNGGDYERASDAWVTFAPDGTAHQISISFAESDNPSSVLVSRSTDSGSTWSNAITLIRDEDPNVLNDKESITADPQNSNLVYAIWDRLDSTNDVTFGPTKFARTTDGGQTWEPTRTIYDPGVNAQTIGNQIVVLPNGDLVDLFTLITDESATSNGNLFVAIIRSTDKGQTWSQPIIINTLESVGVTDPETGDQVRTGDILPDIAVDQRTGNLYITWQDARFSGGKRDGIVFSKSTDQGFTWSAPVQVNRVPQVPAFTAAVDVAVDGAIGLTYYDFRNDTSDPNTLPTNYLFAISYDGGTTWRESEVGDPFDMRTAPLTTSGFFVGDYEGLTHTGALFNVMFVRTNSEDAANRTDVFYTLQYNGNVVYTANSTVNSSGPSNVGVAAESSLPDAERETGSGGGGKKKKCKDSGGRNRNQ